MGRPSWKVFIAIALLAGAVMLFEIALTRIFSFAIWHHFVFMVISVALLGFALSGVGLQLRPALGSPPTQRAAWYTVLFGVTAVVAVWVVAQVPFDSTRIAREPVQLVYLGVYYATLLVPFTLAGLALVSLLNGFPAVVGQLYASDLVGAGLGCLAVVGTMQWVGGDGVILLVATTAAASAWLLRLEVPKGRASLAPGWLLVVAACALAVPWAPRLLPIRPGVGKALTEMLDTQRFPHARLAYSQWNALSRIDVVEQSGTVRWTGSPNSPTASPPETQIVIDGDAATPLVRNDGDLQALTFLDYTLSSATSQVFHPKRALVIGAGGGVDVLAALHHGAAHVDAVEINPIIVGLATERYADWVGHLFQRPEVTLHVGEGRSFVRQRLARYDMIQLSLIDTWAASASGAYSLAEGYLYTVEAFEDYLEDLTDDGVLTLTRWLWQPPRETLKLCTVAAAALRRRGVDHPERHVAILASEQLGTMLVKRSPLTAADLAALRQVAEARRFQILYAPGLVGPNEYGRFFTAANPDAFVNAYPYDVRPATDDSPFFFQFGWWRDAKLLGSGWRLSTYLLSGRLVLLATFVQAFAASLALLVVPLVVGGMRSAAAEHARPSGVLAYFFLIGLAFMLLEITLMQRFTLFLGHPVYAIALVLAVLLISAGAGSRCAARLTGTARRPWPVFLAIAGLTVLYAIGLAPVFRAALGLALPVRLGFAALLLFPLGFCLGVPFPAAIASLVRSHPSPPIGWAWAANGCASVVGPILAVLLAMDLGFATVMILAALGYVGACLIYGTWAETPAD